MQQVKLSEVPTFLRDGSIYQNFIEGNDDHESTVYVQHFRENSRIDDITSYKEVITVCDYWNCPYPPDVYQFLDTNPVQFFWTFFEEFKEGKQELHVILEYLAEKHLDAIFKTSDDVSRLFNSKVKFTKTFLINLTDINVKHMREDRSLQLAVYFVIKEHGYNLRDFSLLVPFLLTECDMFIIKYMGHEDDFLLVRSISEFLIFSDRVVNLRQKQFNVRGTEIQIKDVISGKYNICNILDSVDLNFIMNFGILGKYTLFENFLFHLSRSPINLKFKRKVLQLCHSRVKNVSLRPVTKSIESELIGPNPWFSDDDAVRTGKTFKTAFRLWPELHAQYDEYTRSDILIYQACMKHIMEIISSCINS